MNKVSPYKVPSLLEEQPVKRSPSLERIIVDLLDQNAARLIGANGANGTDGSTGSTGATGQVSLTLLFGCR